MSFKFTRTVVEFTHAERRDGRVSFYGSRIDLKDCIGFSRVFGLRFSKLDESLYLIPFGNKDNVVHGIGPSDNFQCLLGDGDRHISFHETGVVNVTLGEARYRLRGPTIHPNSNKAILSFATRRSENRVLSDSELTAKGKPILVGGIGDELAVCVAVFVESGNGTIEERLNRPFVYPRPPIMQVVDYALRIKQRNLTYWFSTWSAVPEFDGDWIVSAGKLPGEMMKYFDNTKC